MSKITKIIVGVIVIVLVVLVGYNLSSKSQGPVSKEPVKIGATLATTGSLSYLGESERNGLILGFDEINANGGINGRPIKFIVEDNQGDATKAVTGVNKLLSLDKVDILISAFTHITTAVKKLAADSNKILFYISSVREIAQENKLFFRDFWDAEEHGRILASVVNQQGYKNVNFLTEVSDSAIAFEKGFNAEAQKFGIKVVMKETYDPKTMDFKTLLTKIKASEADALVLFSWRHEHIIMPQMKALGMINIPTFHTTVPFLPVADTQEMRNLLYENKAISTWYGPMDKKAEKSAVFIKKYVAKYGVEPRADSFYSYDDAYVISAAIKNCLSDKTTAIDSQCIANELLKTNYDGAAGKLSFDKDGLSTREVVMIQAKDGKWEEFSVK